MKNEYESEHAVTTTTNPPPDRGAYRKGDVYDLTIRATVQDDRAGGVLRLRISLPHSHSRPDRIIEVYPSDVTLTPVENPTPDLRVAVPREEPLRASMDHTPGGWVDDRPSRGGL